MLKVLPGERLPLSNVLLESAVTVCTTESLLVQITVLPFLTVSVAGEKFMLAMLTELVDAGWLDFVLELLLGFVAKLFELLTGAGAGVAELLFFLLLRAIPATATIIIITTKSGPHFFIAFFPLNVFLL
jgi:hypothetical protein